jgi:hypothetical protein
VIVLSEECVVEWKYCDRVTAMVYCGVVGTLIVLEGLCAVEWRYYDSVTVIVYCGGEVL